MLLDGLQSYIYDKLYPHGGVDYLNGSAIRFADDIIITARCKDSAAKIMGTCDPLLTPKPGQERMRITVAWLCLWQQEHG